MSECEYPYAAKQRVTGLLSSLRTWWSRDPEQEVQGFALPVIDAAIAEITAALPDDRVVASVADVVSAEMIGLAEPVRAADMLVVVEQLDAAIGTPPPQIA